MAGKYQKPFDGIPFFPSIALKGVSPLAESEQALSNLPTVSPGVMAMRPNILSKPLHSNSLLNCGMACHSLLQLISHLPSKMQENP